MRNLLLLSLLVIIGGCATDPDTERDADQARRNANHSTNLFERQAEQEKQDFEEP